MKAIRADAARLFLEGAIALTEMSRNGIAVDGAYLESAIAEQSVKVKRLEEKLRRDEVFRTWRKRHADKANLGSREQLCQVLFEDMRLPYDEERFQRTEKTKRWKATEEVVASVDHPFARRYIRFQKSSGLLTRLKSLKRETVGGRLHCDFKLHSARSYRSSSGSDREEGRGEKGFNFQNIPHRDEGQAAAIRRAFVPSPGNVLVEVDLAAHEFRCAAAIWNDPEMIAYVKEGRDVHRDLAARMFLCEPDQVSSGAGGMRHLGKNGFVFPFIYGSYHVQIATNVWRDCEKVLMADGETKVRDWLAERGVMTRDDFERIVEKVCEWFKGKFKVFAEGKEKVIREYRKEAGFDLVTGFRVDGIYNNNAVLNYRVQGPAFHCLLKAGIIEVLRRIKKYQMRTKLVGTIHDSTEADTPEREVQDYLSICREVIVDWLPKQWDWLVVPLGIECKIGVSNWHDSETWTEKGGRWERPMKFL